jgi:hypothetical protein
MWLLKQQHPFLAGTKQVVFIWVLKVIHQFFIINYQGALLKLMIHVLEHLRTVTRLLHQPEVLLGHLLRRRWEEGGRWVILPHLRVITPVESLLAGVLLLQLLVEIEVVFLQVYYHHCDVIFAVIVGHSFVSYLLRNLVEGHSLFSELVDHLGNLFLTVDEIETIR